MRIKDILYTLRYEPKRVWFWWHQRDLLSGQRFTLRQAIRATIENPPSFDQFYNWKECELICDHTPQWSGDGYFCSNCGVEFVIKRRKNERNNN